MIQMVEKLPAVWIQMPRDERSKWEQVVAGHSQHGHDKSSVGLAALMAFMKMPSKERDALIELARQALEDDKLAVKRAARSAQPPGPDGQIIPRDNRGKKRG